MTYDQCNYICFRYGMRIPNNKEGFDRTIATGCSYDFNNVFIDLSASTSETELTPEPAPPQPAPEPAPEPSPEPSPEPQCNPQRNVNSFSQLPGITGDYQIGLQYWRDVTLHVHTHNPLYEYAITPDYSERKEFGCIAISNSVLRNTGDYSSREPWIMISNDIPSCAVMDIDQVGDQEYSIFLKGRVDGDVWFPGFLGTNSQDIDNRNHHSGYLSATKYEISTWKLIEYDDGYLIQQVSNKNVDQCTASFNSNYWFLLAGIDAGSSMDDTELLIQGGQNGEFKWQTVWTIGDKDSAFYSINTLFVLLGLYALI